MTVDSEEFRVACHEAGHAVAAVRLGVQFETVKIGVDLGEVETNDTIRPDNISQLQQCCAAGAAAELIFFDNCRDSASRIDRSLHAKYENRRAGDRGNNGWNQDVEACKSILDRESIEVIVLALQAEKELSEGKVYKLLGLPPPWLRKR